LYIHPEECIDCGACVPACPVAAIYDGLDSTPASQKMLIEANAIYRAGDADTVARAEAIVKAHESAHPELMAIDPKDRATKHGKSSPLLPGPPTPRQNRPGHPESAPGRGEKQQHRQAGIAEDRERRLHTHQHGGAHDQRRQDEAERDAVRDLLEPVDDRAVVDDLDLQTQVV